MMIKQETSGWWDKHETGAYLLVSLSPLLGRGDCLIAYRAGNPRKRSKIVGEQWMGKGGERE